MNVLFQSEGNVPIEFDEREEDVVLLWQNSKTDVNVLVVDRDKLDDLIAILISIKAKTK
jgi:hypothetical protein